MGLLESMIKRLSFRYLATVSMAEFNLSGVRASRLRAAKAGNASTRAELEESTKRAEENFIANEKRDNRKATMQINGLARIRYYKE